VLGGISELENNEVVYMDKAAQRKLFRIVAIFLLIIGGINWGLQIFNINLLLSLGQAINFLMLTTGLYALEFVAAIYLLLNLKE